MMLLPKDNNIDISMLYPPHYRKCKQSNNMIELANYILYRFSKKIEKRLKKFTFSDGVTVEYATKLLDIIHVVYETGVLNFINAKKMPYSLQKLHHNMVQHLPFKKEQLSVKEENFIISITYNTKENKEEYDKVKRYKPFLQSYLPLLFPSYYTIVVNIVFYNTIKDFAFTISAYSTQTITQLETMTIDRE